MTIGENIKNLRLERGYSQKKLGDLCVPTIDASNIRRIESGRTHPTNLTLWRIAKALNVEVADLTKGIVVNSKIKTEVDYRSAARNYVTSKCGFDFESGYDENTSDPWFRFFSDTESVLCNTEEFNNLLNKIADDAVSTFAAFLWQHQHDSDM